MPGSDKAANTTEKAAAISNGNVVQIGTAPELDDFGLPVKKHISAMPVAQSDAEDAASPRTSQERVNGHTVKGEPVAAGNSNSRLEGKTEPIDGDSSEEEDFKDARSTPVPATPIPNLKDLTEQVEECEPIRSADLKREAEKEPAAKPSDRNIDVTKPRETVQEINPENDAAHKSSKPAAEKSRPPDIDVSKPQVAGGINSQNHSSVTSPTRHTRGQSSKGAGISEWSHQHLLQPEVEAPQQEEDEWQTMPAYAPFDIYDDDNKLIAKEAQLSDDEADAYAGLGGAGKGYTRVQLDEDAQSATSLDENTQYLFKEVNGGTGAGQEEDEEQRDAVSQMQATKDLLTEGQRIAYVGMTRLILSEMIKQAESVIGASKGTKKEMQTAAEAMQMWGQKMMVRLYAHMDISTAEQIMIEQLAEHGVVPADLTPTLMQNARVRNPMADEASSIAGPPSPRPGSIASTDKSSRISVSSPKASMSTSTSHKSPGPEEEEAAQMPPPYQEHEGEDLPEVRTPSQLPTTQNLDIDLRWTVLCDLFLTLIADSVYDSRSRVLLERVGENMGVSWLEICRFEKRVTDALEMQQAAEKENWNEDEHKENRRKLALKKRYMMMGLATVGGGLVIGLSAGLLAPLIGAGLAAGFTTIGVAGTSGFLAGAGGAAIITTGAATSGGIIAVRAANRRTGAVKTFEYRPLHNNKRVNLIVTVSGWMTGKVDDVRLPYSTVDPIMGDIYSVLWEPEMLTSMGDTINILATEALTQGLQQVLGSTILIGLMAALQLPVVLTKLAYLIDNPWTVSLDRANSAGLILADSLIDRNLGARPITFVGYSLGSRVIFSCLRELSKKGAYGLVQNVYLFGSPIVAKKDEYLRARSVVSGRFVNGYAKNDWILGYLFRLTSGGISRVAGLAPVEEIPGLENVDVTELVPGHMAYRTAMPRLLREVGWMVESDEFTEIEDPDPENHAKRQRELINEIEEARKEFEKKEKEGKGSGKFGWLSRKKRTALEKKEWEMYEESKGNFEASRTEDSEGNNHGVLFDIDAIRAELASEQMEVRELKSTLPPMKLDLGSSSTSSSRAPLRETKSFDAATMLTPNPPLRPSPAHSPRGSISESPLVYRSPSRKDETEDDGVSMTFDTSYESPARSASGSFNHLPIHTSASPNISQSGFGHPSAEPMDRAATLRRPSLKSSSTLPLATTLPTTLPAISLDHNAWADEDEDFGREKEIEMTFA